MTRAFTKQLLLAIALLAGGSAIVSLWLPKWPSQFVVLMPTSGAVPHSFFGMTIHRYPITPWPTVPVASLRTWDTAVNWNDIQPDPQTFNWRNLDELVDLAQKRNVDVLFTLGRTPRWASANPEAKSPYGPGQCAPPADLRYWDEFLRAVATRAAGKIKFWETWNEPQNPEFYCGDISTMVKLQRRTYEVIKAIDPHAMILTPSPVNALGPQWMTRFLGGGGGQYADIMSFHGYMDPGAEAESIIGIIATFKNVFTRYGQGSKAVWDTEAGWGEDAWLPDRTRQAAFLAKLYFLHWSAGVERFYWYAYDNSKWGTLWDDVAGLHEAGRAYSQVYEWLRGASMTAPCKVVQGAWQCNLVRENGDKSLVVWMSDALGKASPGIMMPTSFRRYRDLDGNIHDLVGGEVEVSGAPIMLEMATDNQ